MNEPQGFGNKLRKLLRYAGIYGWARAINKSLARQRRGWLIRPPVRRRKAVISLVGCGQFAFSTICYFLIKQQGNRFLSVYDTNPEQACSLSRYYGFREVAVSFETLLHNPALEVLYVASNHASHATYAAKGLAENKLVYVEKPIAVTRYQLIQLARAVRQSSGRLFAGYNRPYSKAIRLLNQRIDASSGPGSFSISYIVNGHHIPASHWYREPQEGTRICGNLGHWIDLTIHLFAWRGQPDWINVQITYANANEPDDNLAVTFSTSCHDIVSLVLTSRSEPFEGVREFINIQYKDIIAQIDDFRQMTIWHGAAKKSWRFIPKDVGHERAILQPFSGTNRNWSEVELSTLLMLFITDMVGQRQTESRFQVYQELARFQTELQSDHFSQSPPSHENH